MRKMDSALGIGFLAAVTFVGVKGFTFTPDIYPPSESVKMEKPGVYAVTLAKTNDLKDGDTVRLMASKDPELNAVAHVVSDNTFTIETKEPIGDKVFVYGKQCTDLKAVDYDAIGMLNVSATQELAKKVKALEQENSDLQTQTKRLSAIEEQERATVEEQNNKIADQDKKIAALEATNDKVAAMAGKMEATGEEDGFNAGERERRCAAGRTEPIMRSACTVSTVVLLSSRISCSAI